MEINENKKSSVETISSSSNNNNNYNKDQQQQQQQNNSNNTNNNSNSIHESIPRERIAEDVFDKYEIERVLGSGSMGEVASVRVRTGKIGGSAFVTKKRGFIGRVFKLQHRIGQLDDNERSSEHEYALKSIILDRVSPTFIKELQNEITILRSLDHPNIVKLHEVYTYKSMIYLVLEKCDGGDLYVRSPYSERDSARIMDQLESAILYMHEHGVVHRDLKYENIMFENTSPSAQIKVIDYGLSKQFLSGKPKYMTERVGTIYTMSPQVLQGIYSSQADLWASGVIAYMLLSSTKPFYNKRRRKMIDSIMRVDYKMDEEDGCCPAAWENISDVAKDFVRKLLVLDPRERMNAAQALQHDFLVKREQLPDERPSPDILATIDDCLVNYTQTSKLKKLALNIIAHRSTMKEISELRKAFDSMDTYHNGVLSFDEFKQALLKDSNYSDETLAEMFSSIDTNQNGKINYTEFLAATIEANGNIAEDRIAEAFDRLDCDDSGYISKQNLQDILGESYTKEEVEHIMQWADADGDGKITYKEFLTAFRSKTHSVANQLAHMDSVASEGDQDLVGLDANIPGGKFDPNLRDSLKAQAADIPALQAQLQDMSG